MDQIFELMTQLSIDPFMHQAFSRDSQDILRRAGLSPADPASLARVTGDGAVLAQGTWERCAVLVDPGFDPIDDTDPPSATV